MAPIADENKTHHVVPVVSDVSAMRRCRTTIALMSAVVAVLAGAMSACGSSERAELSAPANASTPLDDVESVDAGVAPSFSPTAPDTSLEPTDAPDTETSPATTTPSVPVTSTTVITPSWQDDSTTGERCVRLADFTTADSWLVVNDGVMGGRSQGSATLVDGVLVFAGNIETDGGGFSSVRGLVTADVPPEASVFRIRLRTDGRSYELQVDDAAPDRDPRITHYIALTGTEAGEWSDITVSARDAEARTFGVPRDASPLDMTSLVSIGIILADGIDGTFTIDVDHIDACATAVPGPATQRVDSPGLRM